MFHAKDAKIRKVFKINNSGFAFLASLREISFIRMSSKWNLK